MEELRSDNVRVRNRMEKDMVWKNLNYAVCKQP